MGNSNGWIGVDLDATLAHYDHWRGETHIGEPIPIMLERVKHWLSKGQEVRIMTARASTGSPVVEAAIHAWCLKHLGTALPVTCSKDFKMIELWDDRAVQLLPNTGLRADETE